MPLSWKSTHNDEIRNLRKANRILLVNLLWKWPNTQASVTLWVQRNIHSRCLQLVWFFAVLLSALPHCRIFSKSTTTREWLTCIWDTLQFRKTFFKKKKGVETVKPKFSVDTLKDNVDNAKSCQWKRFILQFAAGVFLSRWQGRCLYY